MPEGSTAARLSILPRGRRVVLAVATEGSMARLGEVAVPTETVQVQGIGEAIAALRFHDVAVVAAEIDRAEDALALVRAARRARPPVRVLALVGPELPDAREGSLSEIAGGPHPPMRLIAWPCDAEALSAAVVGALAEYDADLAHRDAPAPISRFVRPPGEGVTETVAWRRAEARLVEALATCLAASSHAFNANQRDAPSAALTECVQVASRVASGETTGVAALTALAAALEVAATCGTRVRTDAA
ncbi:MAG: hypothetical protein DWG80_07085 [Chloroflexi bacterium]|nr:hypothetical protein [Chloroflexota bacterium]